MLLVFPIEILLIILYNKLGNHVSRKHRHLSKIFKPQKPAKVVTEGQFTRKRGRPRKYPLTHAHDNDGLDDDHYRKSSFLPLGNDHHYKGNSSPSSFLDHDSSPSTDKVVMVMDMLHKDMDVDPPFVGSSLERSPEFGMLSARILYPVMSRYSLTFKYT